MKRNLDQYKEIAKRGRPLLGEKKREHIVKIKLTAEEILRLKKMEEQLKINRSDLIRGRVFTGSEKILVDSAELLTKLDSIGAELGRSGNNINQMSRHANILNRNGSMSGFDWQAFDLHFQAYLSQRESLVQILRRLLQLMKA